MDQAKLPKVRASLDAIESRLNEIQGRDYACLLNIGWAGGFLSKAAFLDTESEDYRKLLGRLPYYERAIRTGMVFPKTRRIIFEQNQPSTLAGWVMFEIS
jgi:CRISPR-associated protein Csm5